MVRQPDNSLNYLQEWQAETSLEVPLPISLSCINDMNKDIRNLIERYCEINNRIGAFGAPAHGIYQWMSASHIFEASASLVQMDILHDLFGDRGISLFLRHLSSTPAARKYMWAINDMSEMALARKNTEKFGRTASFVCWASLQGTRSTKSFDKADAVSIVTYFHALADYITDRPCESGTVQELMSRVGDFNASWSIPSLRDILQLNKARISNLVVKFDEEWKKLGWKDPDELKSPIKAISDAHANIIAFINEYPQLYFTGRFYCHALFSVILPAVRV